MEEVTGKSGFLHHDVVATGDQYGDKTSHVRQVYNVQRTQLGGWGTISDSQTIRTLTL